MIRTGTPGRARILGTVVRGRSAHDTRNSAAARIPLRTAVSDDTWMQRAACGDADMSLFFAPDGEKVRDRDQREFNALAVCAVCPVKPACAAYTLANPDLTRYGIWGGLTEEDRGEAHTTKHAAERRRARQVSKAVMASPSKTAPEGAGRLSAPLAGAGSTPALSKPAVDGQRACAPVAAGAVP